MQYDRKLLVGQAVSPYGDGSAVDASVVYVAQPARNNAHGNASRITDGFLSPNPLETNRVIVVNSPKDHMQNGCMIISLVCLFFLILSLIISIM
ncbi:MAG: hypothetical protein EBR09_16790 [Proteobacteria bacterium]|nr:hypothetical protein [Pseudomonadota bacterium]